MTTLQCSVLLILILAGNYANASCAPGNIPQDHVIGTMVHLGWWGTFSSLVFGDGPAAEIWSRSGAQADAIAAGTGLDTTQMSGYFYIQMSGTFKPNALYNQNICVYKELGETLEEAMEEMFESATNPATTEVIDNNTGGSVSNIDNPSHPVFNGHATYNQITRRGTGCSGSVCHTVTTVVASYWSYDSTPDHDAAYMMK